jgi:hypothetical protein
VTRLQVAGLGYPQRPERPGSLRGDRLGGQADVVAALVEQRYAAYRSAPTMHARRKPVPDPVTLNDLFTRGSVKLTKVHRHCTHPWIAMHPPDDARRSPRGSHDQPPWLQAQGGSDHLPFFFGLRSACARSLAATSLTFFGVFGSRSSLPALLAGFRPVPPPQPNLLLHLMRYRSLYWGRALIRSCSILRP